MAKKSKTTGIVSKIETMRDLAASSLFLHERTLCVISWSSPKAAMLRSNQPLRRPIMLNLPSTEVSKRRSLSFSLSVCIIFMPSRE